MKYVNENIIMNEVLTDTDYTDKRRTTSLVLDVETTLAKGNETAVFDIGWTVSEVAKENMVIHRSYLVLETFLDMSMMTRAHYFNKYPQYVLGLANGTIEIKEWNEIINTLEKDMKTLNVKAMYAYNSNFDKKAISSTDKLLNPSRTLEYDIKCLWSGVVHTFLNTKEYIHTAIAQDWYNENTGNIFTGAEFAYRYLSKEYDFIEAHTGLEDSIIETKILWAIMRTNKKRNFDIDTRVWEIVQDTRKDLGIEIEIIPKEKIKKKREWVKLDNAKTETIKLDDRIIDIKVTLKE